MLTSTDKAVAAILDYVQAKDPGARHDLAIREACTLGLPLEASVLLQAMVFAHGCAVRQLSLTGGTTTSVVDIDMTTYASQTVSGGIAAALDIFAWGVINKHMSGRFGKVDPRSLFAAFVLASLTPGYAQTVDSFGVGRLIEKLRGGSFRPKSLSDAWDTLKNCYRQAPRCRQVNRLDPHQHAHRGHQHGHRQHHRSLASTAFHQNVDKRKSMDSLARLGANHSDTLCYRDDLQRRMASEDASSCQCFGGTQY